MADHKTWKLPVKRVASRDQKDKSIVWNNVHVCYEQNLFGQVNAIQYNHSGSQIGCVSTNQILLLRVPHSDGAVWNEQTARRVHSMRFRDDDKLVIQAVEQRVVVRSSDTAFERQVQGHTRDVRDAIFLNRQTFASCSDDTTVRVWDLVSQSELGVGRAHTDYVRSLAFHSDGCFYSGSYDHTIKLWDVRTELKSATATLLPALDAPVEQLLYVPSENWLVSSNTDVVTVFDTRTNQVLTQSSQHTKAVTALCYDSHNRTLVTGSLDQRVKFLTMQGESLRAIASKKFDHPVTAVGVHPETSEFAVGFATGGLKILKIEAPFVEKKEELLNEDERARIQTDKELGLGGTANVSQAERKEELLKEKIAAVRQLFVVFQYHKAMKLALYSRMPEVILSTLEELLRRGALHVALSGHTDRTIVQLLRFAVERLDVPSLTDMLLTVLDLILNIYGEAASSSVFFHRELIIAHKRVGDALKSLRSMESTVGVMELIVNDV